MDKDQFGLYVRVVACVRPVDLVWKMIQNPTYIASLPNYAFFLKKYLIQECCKKVPIKQVICHCRNFCRKLHSHRRSRLRVISNKSGKSVNEYDIVIMEDSITLDYLGKQV